MLIQLFATILCANGIILAGLIGIRLIFFGVTRANKYLGEIQYDSAGIRVLNVLGWVVLSLGLLYLYAGWFLAPAIVVMESTWGSEPLRRSACLAKGNRGVVVCLLVYTCSQTWQHVFAFGFWVHIIPFGSDVYQSVFLVLWMGLGSYLLATPLLHCLIAITILHKNLKALEVEFPEEIKEEYVSLPLDKEKVPHVV